MALPKPDVTKIVQGGQNRVKVFSKQVTEAPTATVAFSDTDLVTYLSDIGDMGASKDSKSISLFHLTQDAKLPGNSSIKDLQITEALTTEQIAIRKTQYEQGKFIVFGFFDANNRQLYGCMGFISEWGMTLSNGDVCKLTYKLSVSMDNVVATMPSV